MGLQPLAVARDRNLVQPMLERLKERPWNGHFICRHDRRFGARLDDLGGQTVLLLMPMLGGSELVEIKDLLDSSPELSVVAIAGRLTDEPDAVGLFNSVLSRTVIVDLRRMDSEGGDAWCDFVRDVPSAIWGDVAELAAARATGLQVLTDDGVLAPAVIPVIEAAKRCPVTLALLQAPVQFRA